VTALALLKHYAFHIVVDRIYTSRKWVLVRERHIVVETLTNFLACYPKFITLSFFVSGEDTLLLGKNIYLQCLLSMIAKYLWGLRGICGMVVNSACPLIGFLNE